MKKRTTKQVGRTVTALLAVEKGNPISRFRYRHMPRHTYIHCQSRSIAARFLADAEAEGFTFGDGTMPTEKKYSDIYALTPDLTISYSGWAGHIMFKQGRGNIVRIDYGKYIAGESNYLM